MRYSMDGEVEKALIASLDGNPPPPPVPRGDWRQLRSVSDGTLAMLRDREQVPETVLVTSSVITTADGGTLSMRWYQKSGSNPGSAVLYLHGGGMLAGSVDLYDGVVANYVDQTGVPMLAPDYRLAPEHPHPLPLQDCHAGLLWLVEHAAGLGVDPLRIAVMGDSAGGGLAAGVAMLARDGGVPLSRLILVYPMLDDRRCKDDANTAPFATWTADNNWTGWHSLLGDPLGGEEVPALAAPARQADLSRMPPTYLEVGDLDIFRSEGVDFAARLANAGVPIELHVHSGVPHAFERIAPDAGVSIRAMADRTRVISDL